MVCVFVQATANTLPVLSNAAMTEPPISFNMPYVQFSRRREAAARRTLHSGRRKSHNRTVPSSPAEMNVSSIGFICSDRTLESVWCSECMDPSASYPACPHVRLMIPQPRSQKQQRTPRDKKEHSPSSMTLEIRQILVIMRRMVSQRMIVPKRASMDNVAWSVGEPGESCSVFLRHVPLD